jgi:hypothetical protein
MATLAALVAAAGAAIGYLHWDDFWRHQHLMYGHIDPNMKKDVERIVNKKRRPPIKKAGDRPAKKGKGMGGGAKPVVTYKRVPKRKRPEAPVRPRKDVRPDRWTGDRQAWAIRKQREREELQEEEDEREEERRIRRERAEAAKHGPVEMSDGEDGRILYKFRRINPLNGRMETKSYEGWKRIYERAGMPEMMDNIHPRGLFNKNNKVLPKRGNKGKEPDEDQPRRSNDPTGPRIPVDERIGPEIGPRERIAQKRRPQPPGGLRGKLGRGPPLPPRPPDQRPPVAVNVNHRHGRITQRIFHEISPFATHGRFAHEYRLRHKGFLDTLVSRSNIGFGNTQASLGGYMQCITNIARGNGTSKRIRDEVEVNNIHLRGWMANDSTAEYDRATFMLIYDKQPPGTNNLPEITDIVGPNTIPHHDISNGTRFECLKRWDTIFVGRVFTGTGNPSNLTSKTAHCIEETLELSKVVEFKPSIDDGSLASIAYGAIYLVCLGLQGGDGWTMSCNVRIAYTDLGLGEKFK